MSSFGIGGTNAHVVLEQAPPAAPSGPSRPWQLLVLSAATATAREATTVRLADDLRADPEKNLADVAFTCQVGRRRLPYRRVLVCGRIQDAVAALDHPQEHAYDAFVEHAERSVVFLFSGLGDHYPGMARELYEHEPLFRAEVDRCCELLQPDLGLDLRALLYPAAAGRESTLDLRALVGRGAPPDALGPLAATRLAQPAVFVVELALARLLFADADGVAARVARQPAVGGRRQVTLVRAGTGYARLEEGIYEIDPERPEDYRALFAALAERSRLPRHVAHFLSLPATAADAWPCSRPAPPTSISIPSTRPNA